MVHISTSSAQQTPVMGRSCNLTSVLCLTIAIDVKGCRRSSNSEFNVDHESVESL